MKLALLFLAALAWGQNASVAIPADAVPGEVYTAEGSQTKQIVELKEQVRQLSALVTYWSREATVCEAQPRIAQINMQILQQIAPPPKPVPVKPKEGAQQ